MPDNILVTGTGSGFGLLMVQTLLGKGLTVYAGIRDPHGRNAERAASLQTFAEGSNGTLAIVDLDVLKEADCRAAADAMMARDGRIDAVFHNAGHLYIG
ncbi:SDR family NAD(P)-dependent oxidoreductase, partial [Sphingomonas bacterium]|uniref:SDR family NAD(P)-dependent oxidoreductase n=1 Tax=Sphingomonas bacterium TaxID=1895847 RepID=UPI0015763CB6